MDLDVVQFLNRSDVRLSTCCNYSHAGDVFFSMWWWFCLVLLTVITNEFTKKDIEKSYDLDNLKGTEAYYSNRYGWTLRKSID